MAIVKCPECDGRISDKAEICPHCGYVIKTKIKNEDKKTYKGENLSKVEIDKKRFNKIKYLLGSLYLLTGVIVLIIAATPFVKIGQVKIANVYKLLFCITSDQSQSIYYLSKLSIPALLFITMGFVYVCIGLSICFDNMKIKNACSNINKKGRVKPLYLKSICNLLFFIMAIIYGIDAFNYYAFSYSKYITIFISISILTIIFDIVKVKLCNGLVLSKNSIIGKDVSDNHRNNNVRFIFLQFFLLIVFFTPGIISHIGYGYLQFFDCNISTYKVSKLELGDELIRDVSNKFCEELNVGENVERHERYSTNYQFWIKAIKEIQGDISLLSEEMVSLEEYIALSKVGSLVGVDLGNYSGLSLKDMQKKYQKDEIQLAKLQNAKEIANVKFDNLHYAKIVIDCQATENRAFGIIFHNSEIVYMELDNDCCVNNEDSIKYGKGNEFFDHIGVKEMIKLSKDKFSLNTDFSKEKISATIKYNDGSIKKYYITVSNAQELNNAGKGVYDLMWEDSWGSYAYEITIS